MIYLLLGRPGSGKSYEAVVFHLLPALNAGRKVITNLPVNRPLIEAINPDFADLLHIRHPKGRWLGSSLEDYGDDWRDDDGKGPLYIIDECHKSLRRGKTPDEIEEWYAEHRHEGADVLLITQFHSKLCRNICEHVDMVYRVTNNRALGHDKSYIRKVLNGIRGAVLSESIRSYDSNNFKLYKSHTKSNVAVKEAMAQDVKPIWKHWSFIGAALFVPLGIIGLFWGGMPFTTPDPSPVNPVPVSTQNVPSDFKVKVTRVKPDNAPTQPPEPPPVQSLPDPPEPEQPPEPDHPFDGVHLHLAGFMQMGERYTYLIYASQNGQRVFTVTEQDLMQAGYRLTPRGRCLLTIQFNDYRHNVICDNPSSQVAIARK